MEISVADSNVRELLFESRLSFDTRSAGLARHLLCCLLETSGVDRTVIQDAELVVFELVMNGVEHGTPDPAHALTVSWSLDPETLRVTVRDEGEEGRVDVQRPTADLPGGRGLAMVEALSERWSVDRSGTGTSVSAWLAVA